MTMVTAIVDLQFGSTGKGLMAGYLSKKEDFDMVVSANMPNAGHTFVDSDGRAWVNKVLPSGVYSPSLNIIGIGPGAVFDPAQLVKEINELRERGIRAQIIIHEAAALLSQEHKNMEQKVLSSISSTMQGSMAAAVDKMMRSPTGNTAAQRMSQLDEFKTADDVPLSVWVTRHEGWLRHVEAANNILVEGSQGYSLGINAGFYPYCTSRDCTVWRLLADAAVHPTSRFRVIGTARVHPIRVGNTEDGWSGGMYPDQEETSWDELGQTPERTTVTNRVRRVFTFSDIQIREAILANRVDEVFLNFCNYNPRLAIDIVNRVNAIGENVLGDRFNQAMLGPGFPKIVKYLGFGPQAEDILELRE